MRSMCYVHLKVLDKFSLTVTDDDKMAA